MVQITAATFCYSSRTRLMSVSLTATKPRRITLSRRVSADRFRFLNIDMMCCPQHFKTKYSPFSHHIQSCYYSITQIYWSVNKSCTLLFPQCRCTNLAPFALAVSAHDSALTASSLRFMRFMTWKRLDKEYWTCPASLSVWILSRKVVVWVRNLYIGPSDKSGMELSPSYLELACMCSGDATDKTHHENSGVWWGCGFAAQTGNVSQNSCRCQWSKDFARHSEAIE